MSPPPSGHGQENDVLAGPRLLAASQFEETVRVTEACTACGACLATCPERALRRAPKRPAVVDAACTGCWACIEICPAGAIVGHRLIAGPGAHAGGHVIPVHPIEAESYRILGERVDLQRWPPLARAVVARVIHASADPGYADTLVVDEEACAAGLAALEAGMPVIVDVEMVAVATRRAGTTCLLDEGRARQANEPGLTVTAAAMRVAAERWPVGAVVVVGNAPTALAEVVRLATTGQWAPSFVIGLPVGFVGAAEAKAALRASGLPSVSNVGERGGSAVAAAALNALWRLRSNGPAR